MVSRESVEGVLGRLRPYLQADGGDIELVSVDDPNASVRMTGVCVGCPSAHQTLVDGLERAVREATSAFGRLHVQNGVAVHPPAERPESVHATLHALLDRACQRRGIPVPVVPPHVEEAFERYAWPGAMAELEAACERIAQDCTCGTVRTGCIPPPVIFRVATNGHPARLPVETTTVSLDDRLDDVESRLIAWALRTADGNKSRAAELLRIKRTTLADRITRHGRPLLVEAGLARPDGDAGRESHS